MRGGQHGLNQTAMASRPHRASTAFGTDYMGIFSPAGTNEAFSMPQASDAFGAGPTFGSSAPSTTSDPPPSPTTERTRAQADNDRPTGRDSIFGHRNETLMRLSVQRAREAEASSPGQTEVARPSAHRSQEAVSVSHPEVQPLHDADTAQRVSPPRRRSIPRRDAPNTNRTVDDRRATLQSFGQRQVRVDSVMTAFSPVKVREARIYNEALESNSEAPTDYHRTNDRPDLDATMLTRRMTAHHTNPRSLLREARRIQSNLEDLVIKDTTNTNTDVNHQTHRGTGKTPMADRIQDIRVRLQKHASAPDLQSTQKSPDHRNPHPLTGKENLPRNRVSPGKTETSVPAPAATGTTSPSNQSVRTVATRLTAATTRQRAAKVQHHRAPSSHSDVKPVAPPTTTNVQREQGSAEQPGSNFQYQLLRQVMQSCLEEFRQQVRVDMQNMHLELLRQFWIQQNDIKELFQQYSPSAALMAEVRRLQEENARLRVNY
ncbi:Protein nedd1 [Gaertneriomyces sp. JEL0708]|nr:Protein nedd1 [Gaertneriomyces sp. JEL0708]